MYEHSVACTLYIMHVHLYIAQLNQNKHAGMLCYELQLAACLSLTTMQGLNFPECGATN